MIAEKFKRTHGQRVSDDGEHRNHSNCHDANACEATPARLYNALLSALGTPIGCYGRYESREGLVLRLTNS